MIGRMCFGVNVSAVRQPAETRFNPYHIVIICYPRPETAPKDRS